MWNLDGNHADFLNFITQLNHFRYVLLILHKIEDFYKEIHVWRIIILKIVQNNLLIWLADSFG